ncbi:TPA: helix-turn-helix domain-containing protein [Escherichia coli]|nr:helix-turn-helix domain-containing protein [Escherichia coli]
MIHISESLLKKKLKAENSSFSRIMLDMSMQKAHTLIRSDHSVSQTAALCGYVNVSYFICQFRRHFKTTPFRLSVKCDNNNLNEKS